MNTENFIVKITGGENPVDSEYVRNTIATAIEWTDTKKTARVMSVEKMVELTPAPATIFNGCAGGLEPSWQLFDDFEIHPCRTDDDATEQCEPEEAQFWTVYGHMKTGGIDALHDSPTEADAYRILDIYKRLSGLPKTGNYSDVKAMTGNYEIAFCPMMFDQYNNSTNCGAAMEHKADYWTVYTTKHEDNGDLSDGGPYECEFSGENAKERAIEYAEGLEAITGWPLDHNAY